MSAGSPHRELLGLVTGYWATQAVHTAARLGLADELAAGPRTVMELTGVLRCDRAALERLLRYLTALGIVSVDAEARYSTTATGELLRSESRFRDLTLLYGAEFYRAWSSLETAVRTGRSAFGECFGVEHFEYFSRDSKAAGTFDRAMAAVTELLAEDVLRAFDFSPAGAVVDVGGGDGTLLRAVLRAAPGARGLLYDLGHVVRALAETGESRLTAVAGDFFREVPAGADVYVLSRVLHDWDDEGCASILTACRQAMEDRSTLLVIDRLIPEDGTDSLAVAWDMQMLAVTGGRERTLAEFGALLSAAGFRVENVAPLTLDFSLLTVRPDRRAKERRG